ncbi:MAG: tRNA (guanosine(46)-N7)-methyltransferase TrmB [Cyanobacteriota bacterium]|nr:tRNA (guanosine(46)-N7)-methyltransferase TrmB [Cyanobacteriota bacterium]
MVRQHVNPLSRFYQLPRILPPLQELFPRSELPLHLDIGSARGRFLLALAQQQDSWNHLGLEIRRPLVTAAEADRMALKLDNLRFLFCNANVSLQDWLGALSAGRLQRVTIQFPDPWFKTKHHKRRVLQPELLLALAAAQQSGQELFVQSDVLAVIEPMVAVIEASGCYERPAADSRPWRQDSPLPVRTEREQHVLAQGLPVYRVLYERNSQAPPSFATLQQLLSQTLEQTAEDVDNPPSGAAPP